MTLTKNMSQSPPSPPHPLNLKGVGCSKLKTLNHKVGKRKIIAAIPQQQRCSATTALARLAVLGREDAVVREWLAGEELFSRGELKRFDPARAFFFLFSKASRGELRPLWGPALAASKQAEADAAKAAAKRKSKEAEVAKEREARNAEVHTQAAEILAELGEAEVRHRAEKQFGKLQSSGPIEIVALTLASCDQAARR